MHPLETYLRDLRDIRSTGAAVKETSYYSPLANLLNAVGQTLKPRVRCVINLKDQGAGMPDGGLFTPDQFQKGGDEPLDGQKPSRGAIECKGTKDDAWVTAGSEQVSKYWDKYQQVLVINYRDFVLVGRDDAGRPVLRETFRLAASDKAFWQAAAYPSALVAGQGDRFLDYLRRVMLHPAPLADPKDVAWFLASYARDARARLAAPLPALATVRQALEEALGLRFEGDKGEHFFRSTLVQTLFYGVFSAWVLWHRSHPKPSERFDWEKSAKYLHAPAYAVENAGALRQDWPRVPLSAGENALRASAALGRQVAALLGTESPVTGVTAGKLRPELKVIGASARVGGGSLHAAAGELDVTARWSIAGKGGVCMPAKGKAVERTYTADERAALGLDEATALVCLGESTFDVYLNDVAYWRNVPANVWAYTLGGYQVTKKWLSYREKALLSRGLTLDEVSEVTNMARRIAALLLLQPALDANYQAVKAAAYAWPVLK